MSVGFLVGKADGVVQYKYGYLRAKGKGETDENIIVPKGPLPDILPLNNAKVYNRL